jgi:hypothetical protein
MVALASGPSDRRQSLPLETTDRQTPDLPVSATVVLGRVDIHRVARTDPTRWMIAAKLVSVLS